MAPNFQSSFIPKGPVTEDVFRKKKTGFLGSLLVTLLVLTVLAALGLFFYKGMIKNDIAALQAELASAEKSIDKETISKLSQFGKKIRLAKGVVVEHQVISRFLEELASSTVSSVYFTSFSYNNSKPEEISVTLEGEALGYASVAQQEEVFKKNKYFKSIVFSDLKLEERGRVSFKLRMSLDRQISIYLE